MRWTCRVPWEACVVGRRTQRAISVFVLTSCRHQARQPATRLRTQHQRLHLDLDIPLTLTEPPAGHRQLVRSSPYHVMEDVLAVWRRTAHGTTRYRPCEAEM